MSRPTNKAERRNWVAKNAKRSGAGRHAAKAGERGASRARENAALRRQIATLGDS